MRDRTFPTSRDSRHAATSVDIVLCSPQGRSLAVLLVPGGARTRERWSLPWVPFRGAGDSPDAAARAEAARALGTAPAWIGQAGAFGAEKRPPSASTTLSVAYAAVAPARADELPAAARSFNVADVPSVAPRHRAMIDAAVATLRERMDAAPIAFKLLPPTFTLSELQEIYELLLGRRLHKASFRRALQAAWLVEPIDEWRSEGRGRPAQFYRYAPRRRRASRRGVRFELLGG